MKLLNKFLICLLLFFVNSLSLFAQTYSIETVPNPTKTDNGFISDPSNVIPLKDKVELNGIIKGIADSTTVEIAVAILPSIGKQVPKDFAHQLFNYWGVGKEDNDNGLLILLILDQQRTEFETGYGVEAILPDAICFRIIETINPFFKHGDYVLGMKIALANIAERLIEKENLSYVKAKPKKESSILFSILIAYLCLAILPIIIFTYLNFRYLREIRNSKYDLNNKHKAYATHLYFVSRIWLFLLPIPNLLFYIFIKRKIKRIRKTAPVSKKKGDVLTLVSETEKIDHLTQKQLKETKIGSVEYDVWANKDFSEVVVLNFDVPLSEYDLCKECNYRAIYKKSKRTIEQPSYTKVGLREDNYLCKNCDYQYTEQVELPVLKKKEERKEKKRSTEKTKRSKRYNFGKGDSGGGGAGSNWG